jgi:hypothetical protein
MYGGRGEIVTYKSTVCALDCVEYIKLQTILLWRADCVVAGMSTSYAFVHVNKLVLLSYR